MVENLMPAPYVPPGVTITEAVRPQIVPLVTSTAELVIVGLAGGIQERTDQIVNEEGKRQKLPYLAQVPGSKLHEIKSVYNAFKPSEGEKGKGFVSPTDWNPSGEEFESKKEGEGGRIKNGTVLNITYTYTAGDYFNPIRLFNAAEVEARFGQPISGGKVSSPLTLAALKAFENGARTVICQPLFKTPGGGAIEYNTLGFISNGETPNKSESEDSKVWDKTLEALGTVELIDLLVPAIGTMGLSSSEAIFDSCLKLEQNRAAEQQYVFSVFGLDTTVTAATYAEIRTVGKNLRGYANGTYAQQNILVNTTNFFLRVSQSEELAVGGQYVAASLAGKLAGSPASSSLTRRAVGGFRSVNDHRSAAEKNTDAAEGLCVVEEIRGGTIRVRHGLTLDNEHGSSRSEISVVRAKFNLVESIRETLENQIIGKIIADGNSPVIVRSAIGAVLSVLERTGEIVSYRIPECKISSLEPTTIVASFSYRPAFTLNYIDIVFSLDLSSQTVTVTEEQKV